MLLNNFFSIQTHAFTVGAMKALVSINPHHEIFTGHFPDMPVVPGVCMIQMVKEVFEFGKSRNYHLTTAGNIKFLSVMDPSAYNEIDVLLNYNESASGSVSVQASLFSGPVIFFKLKATLQPS